MSLPPGFWQAIRDRIGLYMHDRMGFDWETIPGLRANLFTTYGTTLRGLITLYDVDLQDYWIFVHDIPMQTFLKPDPELRDLLNSYPQRKIIFTKRGSQTRPACCESPGNRFGI
jgi:hypothetical protein